MITVTESQTTWKIPNIKFEHNYILYLIISRFYVFSSVWLIFLYSLGYSLQIVLLFNFMTLAITITLEIPASFIAEYFGHKQTLMLAYAIYFLSVIILLVDYSLAFLILSNILWGIGNSLSSDTEDVWLFNQLMAENLYDKKATEREFSNIYAKFIFLGFISTGIAEIIGSISYNISVTIPILLSACMMLITAYWIKIVPSIPGHIEETTVETKTGYVVQLQTVAKLRVFRLIVGFIILNSVLFSLFVWFPNYLISLSFESSLISAAIGFGTFITGLGIFLSNKFLTSKKGDNIVKVLLLLLPLLLINLAIQTNLLLLLTMFLVQSIYGSLIPYYRVKVILTLPNEHKQVFLSMIGVLSLFVYIAVDLLTGILIMIIKFTFYFDLVAGFIGLVIIPVILLGMKKEKYLTSQ